MTISPRDQLAANLDRVRGLLALYDEVSGRAAGRPTVREGEVLRAAVVLLHASLEELMRSLALALLPARGSAEVFARLPVPGGDGRRTALTLGDLVPHRGKMVDELLRAAVVTHLDRRSYNNVADPAGTLRDLGLDPGLVSSHANVLQAMMGRRHHIVHRLDRNGGPGRGQHAAHSISKATVRLWLRTIQEFGASLCEHAGLSTGEAVDGSDRESL